MTRTEGGFTLPELLISVTILVGIGAACLGAQLGATTLMNEVTMRSVLEERAFFAVKEIAFDARWAEGAALLLSTESGCSRIDLHTPIDYDHVTHTPVWSTTITWKVVPSTRDANGNGAFDEVCLVRMQGGNTRVVCDDVVPGGFTATRVGDDVTLQVRVLKLHRGRQVAATAANNVSIRN